MASPVQHQANAVMQSNHSSIADSSLLKILSAIPLLGNIPQMIAMNALCNDVAATIGQPDQKERVAEILKTDNDYKTAETIRLVLTLAALVVGVASSLFSAMFAFTFSCSYVAFNIIVNILNNANVSNILKNHVHIAHLSQNNG